MQVYIHVKQLGKRRNVIDKKATQLDKVPDTTAAFQTYECYVRRKPCLNKRYIG